MICREAIAEERNKWENFLCFQDIANFRQSFAWGEIKKLSGWYPIRLLVEDHGQIKAIISILKRNLPGTGKSVLYACRGPVVDFNNYEALKTLVNGIRKMAKTHKSILLRVDPEPLKNNWLQKQLTMMGFHKIPYSYTTWNRTLYAQRMNLEKTEQQLFSQIRRTTRQNINSAYRQGITIDCEPMPEDFKIFYALMNQLETRKSSILHNFEYYRKVWAEIVPTGLGTLIKAKLNEKIIGIILISIIGKNCWAVYMANNYNYRRLMPNKMLMWEAIKFAKRKGCILFDMGATQGTDYNPGASLDNYKKAYKPEIVHFPGYYDLPISPVLYRLFLFAEFKIFPCLLRYRTAVQRSIFRIRPNSVLSLDQSK